MAMFQFLKKRLSLRSGWGRSRRLVERTRELRGGSYGHLAGGMFTLTNFDTKISRARRFLKAIEKLS